MPREAVPVLVRALGAYLRSAQPSDLPPTVRRLREFRPQALTQHAPAVLGLLDDDAQRARIAQWLEKTKPSLKRTESEALRIALSSDGDRNDRLAALTASIKKPVAPKKAPKTTTGTDERDRLRADKAREDLRRVRDERDESRADHRAATRELDRANAEIEKLRGLLAEARKGESSATQALEKERRKSEREVARAREAAEEAKRELKEVRRELSDVRKELRAAQEKPRPAPRATRSATTPERKGPRKPLRAPKGRLDDDPATLDEWLQVPGVQLMVDGYNVVLTRDRGTVRDLADRRHRLIEDLATLIRTKRATGIVVFDGSDVPPGTARRTRGRIRIEYSRHDEIADDHLIAKLEGMPPDPVIVATNDRELQRRAAALGATIATSDQLLALLK
ncbi:MAG: NYN domain-containing protein [Actinomycetota bacterium]